MPKKGGERKKECVKNIVAKGQTSLLDLFAGKRNEKCDSVVNEKDVMGVRSNESDSDDDVQVISVSHSSSSGTKSKYFSPEHKVKSSTGVSKDRRRESLGSKLRLKKSNDRRKSKKSDSDTIDAAVIDSHGPDDTRKSQLKAHDNEFERDGGEPEPDVCSGDESPSKKTRTVVRDNQDIDTLDNTTDVLGCDGSVLDSAPLKRKLSSGTGNSDVSEDHGHKDKKLKLGEGLVEDSHEASCLPSCSQSSNKENANVREINDNETAQSELSCVNTTGRPNVQSDLKEPSESCESHKQEFMEEPSEETPNEKSEQSVIHSQTVPSQEESAPQYKPYYIENFKLVIETILEDDFFNYLFDEEDLRSIETFRSSLSEEAQKLYVRLFLRKHKWLCPRKIQYPKIAEDLSPFLKELVNAGLLSDESSLDGLETCLNLLPADELRTYAKKMHVDVSNLRMPLIVEALVKQSKQRTVGAMFGIKSDLGASMFKRVKSLVGPCYRLQDAPRHIFLRLMMLFSLTATAFEDDEQANSQQLFQILQVNRGLISYASYKIDRKTRIFRCKDDLVRFQTAVNIYSDILASLENHAFDTGADLYRQAKALYSEHCADEELIRFESSLPTFLRIYTAGSVYVRILNQGVEVLQKMKNYAEANTVLEELLNQSVHCQHYRGHWWDRLALNLDQHLKKPDKSLDAVSQGLSDPFVRTGRRLALFQRSQKICDSPSNKKLKKRQKEFKHDKVQDAPKVTIQGKLLPKSILGSQSHFVSQGSVDGRSDEVTLCRVEQVAITHYKREGYDQGIHGESSTFFALLLLYFWDIVFMDGIPDVFYNKFQMAPLDMRSEEFYSNRKRPINKRLKWLKKASKEELLEHLEKTWTENEGITCSAMNWERFESIDQAKTLVQAFGGEFMSGIFKRILKDPRNTSSGMPDLVVWNTDEKTFRLVEVKGPGDKLSTKQILWLDYFLSLGATAEVCHVVGVGAKKLRHSVSRESQDNR